jgi:translation initiation factor 2 beta subunit (eIF-2beta)/eIF-5
MRRYYTLEMLEEFYRCQEPSLSEKVVEEKAKDLKRVLNTLDISWVRSNRQFYAHNQLQNFSQNFI